MHLRVRNREIARLHLRSASTAAIIRRTAAPALHFGLLRIAFTRSRLRPAHCDAIQPIS
jgi:hypothetical protein